MVARGGSGVVVFGGGGERWEKWMMMIKRYKKFWGIMHCMVTTKYIIKKLKK